MRYTTKHLFFAATVALFASLVYAPPQTASAAWKSDPGLPDSLWIPPVPWRGDTLFTLDVYTATDDSLAVAQLVFSWDNPALKIENVDMTVGRWNVVGYHDWTVAGNSTAVALGFIPTQQRLPPGSGPVARIYFGRDSLFSFDSDATVDTATVDNAPPLAPYTTVFSDLPNAPFLPTVVTGATVSFSPCICLTHGDPVVDGNIDSQDLAFMIDGIFFGGPVPGTDPQCPHLHRGDYNCDNVYDSVDLSMIIDYVFFGGPGPCDPCFDL